MRGAANLVANIVLPDRDHINLQAFGDPDPPRSIWDDYNTYRGAQPKGQGKGSVFVQNIEPPSQPEDNSALGTDPAVRRDLSTSEETHTPSPRGPPKANLDPKSSRNSRGNQTIHLRGLRVSVRQIIRSLLRSPSR